MTIISPRRLVAAKPDRIEVAFGIRSDIIIRAIALPMQAAAGAMAAQR